MKALILSVCVHKNSEDLSTALKECLEYRNHTVEIIDIIKYIRDIIENLIKKGLMEKVSPTGIKSIMYSNKKQEKESDNFTRLLYSILSSRLYEYLDEFKPDLIISMHPFGLKMLDKIIYEKKIDIPVIAIFENHSAQSFIFHGFVDAYIIPDEALKHALVSIGIDESMIYPIDAGYSITDLIEALYNKRLNPNLYRLSKVKLKNPAETTYEANK